MKNANYTHKLIITKLITANFLFLTNITAAEDWNVSTLAGSSGGYSDGTGKAAKFKSPYDMTCDNNNNLYVVDSDNNRIRKVDTSSAVVSTVAGSVYGFADGTGDAAKFKNSYGITCDVNGNLYIADTYNQRIRKIDGSTKVTSISGNGTAGYLDGINTKFNYPRGIAWDKSGNIYVADTNNYCIRRLTSKDGGKSWQVDTIAGTGTSGFKDGTGTTARFKSPYDIVCNDTGIYVADTFNNSIRRLTSKDGGKSWQVDTIAGSSTSGFNDGTGKAAKFNGPRGIAYDKAGNIYVADTNNQCIRKIARYNVQLTSLGLSPDNQSTDITNELTLLEKILSYSRWGAGYFFNSMYNFWFG